MSTNVQSEAVSAGWYADPEDVGRLRWWNGAAWTADVIAAAVAIPEAAPETRPDAVPVDPSRIVPDAEPETPPETSQEAVPAAVHEDLPDAVPDAIAGAGVFLSRRQLREKNGPLTTESAEEPEATGPQGPVPPTDESRPPTPPDPEVPPLERRPLSVPAGWYDDPTGLELNRWWNGIEWTEHTAPKPAEPVAAEPVAAEPVAAESPATAFRPRAPEIETLPQDLTHAYVPFGDHRSWQAHVPPIVTAPTRWNTPGAIAVGFTPWVGLMASVGLVVLTLLGSGAWWWLIGAALLPLLWSIAFALRDRNKLDVWGYEARASLGWLFLGPLAYLIARTVRVHQRVRRGSFPLWLFIINSVLISALAVGAGVGLGASVAARGTAAIEQQTEGALHAQGHNYSVVCPASLTIFVVGSTFDCVASDAAGTVGTVSVKIIGANGRFAYRFTPSPSTGA
ncbi:DUF2510 domain-containing protein [Lacisediminihabitans profunda]|uniref:DUF2510 domain-containing protein n=1 Tax=Lacisediminihabitans profunda TaxID=2594790 RepID=UPI00164F62D1|nr:DUF2510 domain-containing protein [Lacisediminihabitans profunda]